jgi:hypothetical protein
MPKHPPSFRLQGLGFISAAAIARRLRHDRRARQQRPHRRR